MFQVTGGSLSVIWQQHPTADGRDKSMAKVLVVEDHLEQADNLARWLTAQAHTVDVVNCGEDALHLFATYAYELLILDWQLPGLSGVEVLQRYRSQGGKAVVLMLTGRSDVPSRAEGLDAGADDYLPKPYDLRELAARVRSLLRRPADTLIETVGCRGIVLHTGTRTAIFNDDQRVELSPREFAVLEYLLRHPNRIFSSKALLDLVWPVETAMSEDTVRSIMRNLRRKLAVSGREIIKTVQSSGYMIENDSAQK